MRALADMFLSNVSYITGIYIRFNTKAEMKTPDSHLRCSNMS